MASPQKENGFTSIANELMEKLASASLNGSEFRICIFVLRKTWGWKKKDDSISISQIEEGTGLSRKMAVETLNKLVTKRLLVKTKKYVNTLQFNKNHEEWVVTNRTLGSYESVTRVVTKTEPKLVTNPKPTKEKKETITKETIPNGIDGTKINTFIGLFKNINPSFERLYAQKGQRDAMSRLVSRYGEQKVENMLRELPSILQKPYAPIITTPYQLEQKLGALLIFIKKEGYGQSKVSVYTGK